MVLVYIMSSSLSRFHKSDAFAAVGLAVLLVWTPAYMAQGDEGRDMASPDIWKMPAPRDGDKLVLELAIKWGEQQVQTLGPLVTIEHRAINGDEAPVPAVFMEQYTYHATDAELDGMSFHMSKSERRTYFDASGRAVWQEIAGYERPREEGADPERVVHGSRPSMAVEGLARYAEDVIEYSPDIVRSMAKGIVTDYVANKRVDWLDPTIPERLYSVLGGTYKGLEMAAVHRGDQVFGNQWKSLWGGDDPLGSSKVSDWLHPAGLPSATLQAPAAEGFSLGQSWTWYARDFPIPVGNHRAYPGPGGQELTIDLVPGTLVRGTGDPFVVVRNGGNLVGDQRVRVPLAAEVQLETIPVRNLMSSPQPVYENVSLADVWDLTKQEADGSLAKDIARGALPIEFRFYTGPSTVDVGTVAGGPLPNLSPAPEAPTRTSVSFWRIAVADSVGKLNVAYTTMYEAQPSQAKRAVVEAICDNEEPSPPGGRSCGESWPRQIDWNERVVAPSALSEQAGRRYPDAAYMREGDQAGHLAWYGPLAYCNVQIQDNGAIGWGDQSVLGGPICGPMQWIREDEERGLWALHANAAAIEQAPAEWRWDKSEGRNRLYIEGTNAMAYGYQARTATTESDPAFGQPRSYQPSTSSVQVIDAVGRTTALAGALLIMASVLIRTVVAIKAGAPLPLALALFSRVQNADALLNERRADIMALLHADPGLTAQDMARRLEYSRTATLHHLETLHRTGQVLYVRNGQQRHFFPLGGTQQARARIAFAQDPTYARFLDAVDAEPGATLSDIQPKLDRSTGRVSRIGTRLVAAGALERRRDGRQVRFYPVAG